MPADRAPDFASSHRPATLVARALGLWITVALLLLPARSAHSHICWIYSENHPATLTTPCGPFTPTTIIEQHGTWHCRFPPANTTAYGAAFIGFHRQFILDFDVYRLNLGFDRLRTWDAIPGDPIPGDDEDYSSGFNHCFSWDPVAVDCVDDDTSRPQNAPCNGCSGLPSDLVGDSNLATYASIGDVGARLEISGWHGNFHCGGADAGGGLCQEINPCDSYVANVCDDIGSSWEAPHDPAFWMGHKKLDEVARDWQRLQAADIVIVIDRSGSMDDNCPGGNADPGETPCKLNDAKEAAKLFASMVQDDRPGSTDEHRIGLVSFATGATKHLGGVMIAAAGAVTEGGGEETPFESALNGIGAGGLTAIGDGIRKGLEVLATGTNAHKALLILSDGEETSAPFISEVRDEIPPEVQVCAIGFGGDFADPDDVLRALAEDFGGAFIADPENTDSPITLEKFFVDCFGQIYDESVSADPIAVLAAGQVATPPILTDICGSDSRLTVVLGRDRGLAACDLRLVVETPAGNLVDLTAPGVERAHDKSWDFARVPLPYNGEGAGTWTAWGVRPQRVFTHGFTTDSYASLPAGVALVRREIHRLFPDGVGTALYYEDGSITGNSAYRQALQLELAAGSLGTLVMASSAADFNAKLAQAWDLIVFARQMNPTVQVYDATLANRICQGQKALITDFYAPAGGPNPILLCAGTLRGGRINWNQVIGDGLLVTGVIPLMNPGYNLFSFEVSPSTQGGPWMIQARNELQSGAIIGNGTNCPDQTYFYSTLVRGFGHVVPAAVRPRVMQGQRIHASFRLRESSRPLGDWDAVSAMVTLDRPGAGPLETYSLFDDGTNGDHLEQDNYWEVEVPTAASTVGPHALHAVFELTKNGCKIRREARTTVVVQPEPNDCTRSFCPPPRTAAAGASVGVLSCARNLCRSADNLEVTITDTRGWLCLVDPNGNHRPAGQVMFTDPFPGAGAGGHCFMTAGNDQLRVCIPPNAPFGDFTVVTYTMRSLGHPNQPPDVCQAHVHVGDVITGQPEPGHAHVAFAVGVSPNPGGGEIRFAMDLPWEGDVTVLMYDVRGRQVATVWDGRLPAGQNELPWQVRDHNGGALAAGVYYYRVSANLADGPREVRGSVVVLR